MVNFDWQDETLTHPDGRANNGEPCIKCNKPVPLNAHWKHRDRHVCSSRCNTNLMHQHKRAVKSGKISEPVVEELKNPRTSDLSIVFRMNTDTSNPVPISYYGFGPKDGDSTVRWNVVTHFMVMPAEMLFTDSFFVNDLYLEEKDRKRMVCVAVHESRHFLVYFLNDNGSSSRSIVRYFFQGECTFREPVFWHNGVALTWARELIRCIDDDGKDYEWETYTCVPASVGNFLFFWSPEYEERSLQRKRTSSSSANHIRRLKIDASKEKFDPLEIFERDNWICQLCHLPVDKTFKRPNMMSASLDHIEPVSIGGSHTRANTQIAHLLCNIKKGNRFIG